MDQQQQNETGVKEEVVADAGQQEETSQAVPYERFKEVNDKVADMQKQLEEAQQQIGLYQANMASQQQQQSRQQPSLNYFDGVDDDEPITAGEARKALLSQAQMTRAAFEQITFIQQHPDYNELVGTPQKPGKAITKAVNANPNILAEIQNSPNPMQTAYNYARLHAEKQPPAEKPDTQKDVQKAIEAANKPKSSANVGGSTGMTKANIYASMSDEDLAKKAAELAARA